MSNKIINVDGEKVIIVGEPITPIEPIALSAPIQFEYQPPLTRRERRQLKRKK